MLNLTDTPTARAYYEAQRLAALQHDAHVTAWRWHLEDLREWLATLDWPLEVRSR